MLTTLKIKHKLRLIAAVIIFGVIILQAFSLLSLKRSLLEEKKLKTRHVVETAYGTLNHFYTLSQEEILCSRITKKTTIRNGYYPCRKGSE